MVSSSASTLKPVQGLFKSDNIDDVVVIVYWTWMTKRHPSGLIVINDRRTVCWVREGTQTKLSQGTSYLTDCWLLMQSLFANINTNQSINILTHPCAAVAGKLICTLNTTVPGLIYYSLTYAQTPPPNYSVHLSQRSPVPANPFSNIIQDTLEMLKINNWFEVSRQSSSWVQ